MLVGVEDTLVVHMGVLVGLAVVRVLVGVFHVVVVVLDVIVDVCQIAVRVLVRMRCSSHVVPFDSRFLCYRR